MDKEKKELLEWAEHFVSICEKNNIWYSVDKETLLGAKVFNAFLPWKLKFEVMMTVESYNKLKRLYRENVIDSFVDSTFNSFSVAFVKSIFDWDAVQPFISIRIILPTRIETANKYIGLWNRITQKITKIRVNLNSAIDYLYNEESDMILFLEKGFKMDRTRFTKNLVYDLEKVKFENIEVNVIANSSTILRNWYGEKYKEITEPDKVYSYPSPLKKILIDKTIADKQNNTSEIVINNSELGDISKKKSKKFKQSAYINSTMEISTVDEMNDYFSKKNKKRGDDVTKNN